MKASEWVRGYALRPKSGPLPAHYELLIPQANQYAAKGVPLPEWSGAQRDLGIFLRNAHWAVGVTVVDLGGGNGGDFELGGSGADVENVHPEGSGSRRGIYIGLRTADLGSTIPAELGRAVASVVKPALEAGVPDLAWIGHEHFWPVSAYIPTGTATTALAYPDYRWSIIEHFWKGYEVVAGIDWSSIPC